MLKYERELWGRGYERIAGVDEVGRGCLFGDVVAAAVILPKGLRIEGVTDSKKMSEKRREYIYEIIMEKAVAVAIGTVDVPTIERINIKQAARLAMKRAIESLPSLPDYALIDAETVDVPVHQLSIIRGDEQSHSIAAASIVAKVTRDRMCLKWDLDYPEYGIAIHKGYATKYHREKILQHGASPLHRMSFLRNLALWQEELS
jgi:ribonuclease HII